MEDVLKKLFKRYLNLYFKIALDKGLNIRILRKSDIKVAQIESDIDSIIEHLSVKKTPVVKIEPRIRKDKRVMMYLHGGSYVSGPIKMQVDFIRNLSVKSKLISYLVDYRLAPEHTYQDAFEDVLHTYDYLLEKESHKEIILIGDSAGGGFVLAFTLYLKSAGKRLPDKIILLSPWLDVSMKNQEITEPAADADFVLGRKGLIEAGLAYAGNRPLNDYMISPLNGNFNGLPKTLLISGTNEILVFDCRRFKALAEKAQVKLTYLEYKDMFHAFMVAPPLISEIKNANREIYRFITK